MGFDRIIGQDRLKSRMSAEVKSRRGNTYIVSGPQGSGKTYIASELARSFICQNPTDNGACGKCSSCIYAGNGSNSDLIRIEPQKNEDRISIDRIREEVVGDYETSPRYSPNKVYVIDADHIGVESQNALLKSIEEPPADVIFILEVTNTDTLLPTIMSRAVEYKILPYTSDEVKEIIRAEGMDIPDSELDMLADLADGIPGRAVRFAQDEAFSELKDSLMGFVLGMNGMRISDAILKGEEIFGEHKDNYLEPTILLLWILGDLMKLRADIDCDRIIFASDRARLERFVVSDDTAGLKEIGRATEAVNGFIEHRKINVNYDGSVTEMIIKIYKEFNK